MASFFKGTLFIISLALILNACAPSQEITEDPAPEDPLVETPYPDWYSQNSFVADSAAYHGFGMAVSGDSVVAMANAGLQARANLEKGISDLLEEIRENIEETGNGVVTESGFIIALRRAHQQVETEADNTAQQAKSEDSFYKGYAQVSITKAELSALLESQLPASHWNTLQSSPQFSEEFN